MVSSHFWPASFSSAVPSPLHQLPGLGGQPVADGVLAQIHAQAVLGVVLKQGVGPGGTLALGGGGVGGGGSRAAPDGGTAGGVGDIHPVAEQLGDETGVSGLGTAGAGAGELQQRLLELAALHGHVGHVGLGGDIGHHVVEHVLLGGLLLLGHHGQGALAGQILAHTPQPMQSRGLTAMANLYTPLPLPAFTSTILAPRGRSWPPPRSGR